MAQVQTCLREISGYEERNDVFFSVPRYKVQGGMWSDCSFINTSQPGVANCCFYY